MIGLRNEYLGLASLAFAFMSLVRDVSAAPADQDLFLRPEDMHTVLFGTLDAGRSVFLTAGVIPARQWADLVGVSAGA